MKYLPFASGSGLLPKLAGTYELEIQPVIDDALKCEYQTIVNIGCGEGYYAVGLALRLPRARVHAFDIDIVARQRARRLARENGVSGRVRVRGRCAPADLRRLVGQGALVVCDCEGCESRLLDLDAAPQLGEADILVELHEFVDPGVSQRLAERFSASHRWEVFTVVPRDVATFPQLVDLTPIQRDLSVWEGRPPGMSWAWFRALGNKRAALAGP